MREVCASVAAYLATDAPADNDAAGRHAWQHATLGPGVANLSQMPRHPGVGAQTSGWAAPPVTAASESCVAMAQTPLRGDARGGCDGRDPGQEVGNTFEHSTAGKCSQPRSPHAVLSRPGLLWQDGRDREGGGARPAHTGGWRRASAHRGRPACPIPSPSSRQPKCRPSEGGSSRTVFALDPNRRSARLTGGTTVAEDGAGLKRVSSIPEPEAPAGGVGSGSPSPAEAGCGRRPARRRRQAGDWGF